MADKIIPPEVWNNRWRREELLTRRRRIRRLRGMPEEFDGEVRRSPKYPHRLEGVLPDGYEAVYRRGTWRKLEVDPRLRRALGPEELGDHAFTGPTGTTVSDHPLVVGGSI